MKKVLVLGIGSKLMMDDGIGIYLVEDLYQKLSAVNLEFVLGETDVYYCLSVLAGAERVIVIDAYLSGKQPGEVTLLPIGDLKASKGSYSLHGIHVLDILQVLSSKLDGVLIGIEPDEIGYGFNLSDRLHNSYASIFNSVYTYLQQYLKERGYKEVN